MAAVAPATNRMVAKSSPNLAPKGSTIDAGRTFATPVTAQSGMNAGCCGSMGGLTRSTLCGAAEGDCIDAVKMTGGGVDTSGGER